MATGVNVRPSAEADVREAAFWYEAKREGLGAEFTLELDAPYDTADGRHRERRGDPYE